MSKQVFEKFYTAFAAHDAEIMASCYHPEVSFNDPVFSNLTQQEVCAMWRMLIQRADGNLTIEHHSTTGDKQLVEGIWEADYVFSKTNKPVHNIIHASMEFQDGLIIKHTDDFNFWRWSRMALGTPGLLLGWTPFLKQKVRDTARKSLDHFLSKQ